MRKCIQRNTKVDNLKSRKQENIRLSRVHVAATRSHSAWPGSSFSMYFQDFVLRLIINIHVERTHRVNRSRSLIN